MHRLDEFGFRADNFKFDHRQDRRALAQGGAAAVERRRLPDEEAQDHGDRRRGEARREGQDRRHKDGKTTEYAAKNIVLATGARARTLARAGAGRQADLDLSRGDGAAELPEIAAGRGLRRHRHRVRQLLPHAGRRGDGGRSARPRAAGGGRRDFAAGRQGVRQAGHEAQGSAPRSRSWRRATTASPPR